MNLIIGCVYKHPRHKVKDLTNSHTMPLLDKLSNENKDIMIMDDFKVNLINCNDDKNTSHFLATMLSHSFLPFITSQIRITRNTKTLIGRISYNKPLNDIMSANLSSIISEHLVQFLIEPSKFKKKSPQMVYRLNATKILTSSSSQRTSLKSTAAAFTMILIQILHLNIFLKL